MIKIKVFKRSKKDNGVLLRGWKDDSVALFAVPATTASTEPEPEREPELEHEPPQDDDILHSDSEYECEDEYEPKRVGGQGDGAQEADEQDPSYNSQEGPGNNSSMKQWEQVIQALESSADCNGTVTTASTSTMSHMSNTNSNHTRNSDTNAGIGLEMVAAALKVLHASKGPTNIPTIAAAYLPNSRHSGSQRERQLEHTHVAHVHDDTHLNRDTAVRRVKSQRARRMVSMDEIMDISNRRPATTPATLLPITRCNSLDWANNKCNHASNNQNIPNRRTQNSSEHNQINSRHHDYAPMPHSSPNSRKSQSQRATRNIPVELDRLSHRGGRAVPILHRDMDNYDSEQDDDDEYHDPRLMAKTNKRPPAGGLGNSYHNPNPSQHSRRSQRGGRATAIDNGYLGCDDSQDQEDQPKRHFLPKSKSVDYSEAIKGSESKFPPKAKSEEYGVTTGSFHGRPSSHRVSLERHGGSRPTSMGNTSNHGSRRSSINSNSGSRRSSLDNVNPTRRSFVDNSFTNVSSNNSKSAAPGGGASRIQELGSAFKRLHEKLEELTPPHEVKDRMRGSDLLSLTGDNTGVIAAAVSHRGARGDKPSSNETPSKIISNTKSEQVSDAAKKLARMCPSAAALLGLDDVEIHTDYDSCSDDEKKEPKYTKRLAKNHGYPRPRRVQSWDPNSKVYNEDSDIDSDYSDNDDGRCCTANPRKTRPPRSTGLGSNAPDFASCHSGIKKAPPHMPRRSRSSNGGSDNKDEDPASAPTSSRQCKSHHGRSLDPFQRINRQPVVSQRNAIQRRRASTAGL